MSNVTAARATLKGAMEQVDVYEKSRKSVFTELGLTKFAKVQFEFSELNSPSWRCPASLSLSNFTSAKTTGLERVIDRSLAANMIFELSNMRMIRA